MNDKLHPALAEHAMETELQLERERHRKTWRQLEQVRGLLGELREITSEYAWDVDLEARVDAALSQQAEPAEPAPAQDAREAREAVVVVGWLGGNGLHSEENEATGAPFPLMTVAQHERIVAALTRPAQTEQQPVAWGAFHFGGCRNGKLYTHCETEEQIESYIADLHRSNDSITLRKGPLYTAPIAQTAPQEERFEK